MNPALMHMLQGMTNAGRSQIAIGVVESVTDTGGAQTVTLVTGDGVRRANVEVFLPFGFSANPVLDGAICLVFCIGGDPSNMGALPIGNASARMGSLAAGESVLYGADGSRVHIRQGGIVDVWGGAQVNIHTTNCTIDAPAGCTINAAGGVTVITPDATFSGNVSAGSGVSDVFSSLEGKSVTVQDGLVIGIT